MAKHAKSFLPEPSEADLTPNEGKVIEWARQAMGRTIEESAPIGSNKLPSPWASPSPI